MGLLGGLVELVFPTRCAGCEAPGAVLCPDCRARLPLIDRQQACPRCGAPYGRLICTECWEREWAFRGSISLGEFEAPLARAVAMHKDAGERRLAEVFGSLLARQVAEEWPGWAEAVVFVPATQAALRRRGFDHGFAIAESIAHHLGVPLACALARTAARDQRSLGRDERAANAAGTFSASGPVPRNVLLSDDVFTTGATLDSAAAALLEAGACDVRCVTVARAW